jgi:hypothetical protein
MENNFLHIINKNFNAAESYEVTQESKRIINLLIQFFKSILNPHREEQIYSKKKFIRKRKT